MNYNAISKPPEQLKGDCCDMMNKEISEESKKSKPMLIGALFLSSAFHTFGIWLEYFEHCVSVLKFSLKPTYVTELQKC